MICFANRLFPFKRVGRISDSVIRHLRFRGVVFQLRPHLQYPFSPNSPSVRTSTPNLPRALRTSVMRSCFGNVRANRDLICRQSSEKSASSGGSVRTAWM
jgi:hypothetical protein